METQFYQQIYDPDFNSDDFLEGCKQAIQVTRELMNSQEKETLKEILTRECYSFAERYFNTLKAANAEFKGSFHSCNKAEITNIFMNESEGKTHVNILVKFDLNERLMITEEEEIIWGSEKYEDRTFHVEFYKSDVNSPWKIASFMGKMGDARRMMESEMENYSKFIAKGKHKK
jgi:hypothetical protein